MGWEILMSYSATTDTYGSHLRIGEASGWVTLLLSTMGCIRGATSLFGNITPDVVNPWLILIASTITGGVAVWTLAYSRIVKARLEGSTLEEIYAANNRAVRANQPVPFPTFMPRGSVTVTTKTTVDVQAKPPEGS